MSFGHENGSDDQRSHEKYDFMFPVMGDRIGKRLGYVPMAMICRHREQAMRNHGGQTPDRLRERGGMSPQEIMATIRGERWHERTFRDSALAWTALKELVATEYPQFDCETGEVNEVPDA